MVGDEEVALSVAGVSSHVFHQLCFIPVMMPPWKMPVGLIMMDLVMDQ